MVRQSVQAASQVQGLVAMRRQSEARILHTEEAVSEWLGALATRVLFEEAYLTPKPGLVDRRGSGCHSDMTLALMEQSARAIEPYFTDMASAAMRMEVGSALRHTLGAIGREAERSMFAATSGVNTHRGAIWIIGLLVAAAAQLPDGDAGQIAERAGEIARIPDVAQLLALSHGELVRLRFSKAGARGEAMGNFPHVTEAGLPALRRSRIDGREEDDSRLNALMAIMSSLDDTCVLYRGGEEGLTAVQAGAARALHAGGAGTPAGDAAILALDERLQSQSLSPGGSADLLAATLLLDVLEHASRIYELRGRPRWTR